MSYYGIRKLKTFQDENGKWNFSCDVYDSSIWSWDNKRVWEHIDNWFKVGYDTKEELERYLFENTLDGNFHGTGGKYGCIAWGNCKVKLSDKELAILDELKKKKYELMYGEETERIENKLKNNNIPYSEWKNDEEYKARTELANKAYKEYSEFRYNAYFRRWKEYLSQQNKNRNGKTYIVQLDFNKNGTIYRNMYVGGHGSMQTTFYYSTYKAKLFKKSVEEIKEMFCDNPKYSNIRLINVSDYLKGTGRRKYVEVASNILPTLETVKC